MSFYRIPLIKNTTLNTLNVSGNSGASSTLLVGGEYVQEKNRKNLYRILSQIDTITLSSDIINGIVTNITIDNSASANLNMFNELTENPNAYEFTIVTYPITKIWSEGRGSREDTFSDIGYANWLNASSTGTWTLSGGDFFIDSNSSSQYFNTGYEDLTANVKSILNNWLNGTSANYGLIIKMDDIAEAITGSTSTNIQYFQKSFFSRHTSYVTKYPYLEILWDGEIKDYRKIFKIGNSGNLYFYNFVNGILTDIDNITTKFPGNISISGSTGGVSSLDSQFISITSGLSASRERTGIYKVNFNIPNNAIVYNYFKDIWTITSSSSSISSSIQQIFSTVTPIGVNNSYDVSTINIILKDFKSELEKDNIVTQRLFIKTNSKNSLPVLTASITSLDSIIIENGYYQVVVNDTNEIYVNWQNLEFDSFGNFFSINTNNYVRNVDFRFNFKINYLGQIFNINNSQTFRIV